MKRIFGLLLLGLLSGNWLFAQVYLNQSGYLPVSGKWVYTPVAADSFTVYLQGNSTPVLKGPLVSRAVNDPNTGLTLYDGDFSALEQPGRYLILVPGAGISATFLIDEQVYLPVRNTALKSYYYQRCGEALSGTPAGSYARPQCHGNDGETHASTGENRHVAAVGGWHDAGDFGKYGVNSGITVGTMLMGYQYFPERFSADDVGIPESGNGIPDILDECRVNIEWMLTMQWSDGAVYHKLTTENFTGFVMPHTVSATRYLMPVSSTATANLVAVAARASRVYAPFDSAFAAHCLSIARGSWDFLIQNPNIVPAGGFRNPSGVGTGQYGDSDDRDERLWAAIEMFLATGETTFHNYYSTRYQNGELVPDPGWPQVRGLAAIAYLLEDQPGMDSLIRDNLHAALISKCQQIVSKSNADGFRVALSPGEFYWGSNSLVLNRALLLIIAFERSGNSTYFQTALDQLHYILGANAHDLSFLTGVGLRYPQHIHNRVSEADGVPGPLPGLLAGGPEQYLSDPELQAAFDGNTPPALCYLDVVGSYASNENAINWNSPLVFVTGYFGNEDAVTGVGQADPVAPPSDFALLTNYPNPFNGNTLIRYRLADAAQPVFEICDPLGKKVAAYRPGYQGAGDYSWSWQPGQLGGEVASGMYFIRMKVGDFSQVRRITYVK